MIFGAKVCQYLKCSYAI